MKWTACSCLARSEGPPRHAGDHSHRSRFDSDAVAATQQVFSFLTKPVDKDALYKAIDEALEQRSPATDEAGAAIVTRSPLMLRLLEQAGMVAQSDVSVLINGQSGTGRRSSPERSTTPARVMISRSWRSTAARCRNSCSN